MDAPCLVVAPPVFAWFAGEGSQCLMWYSMDRYSYERPCNRQSIIAGQLALVGAVVWNNYICVLYGSISFTQPALVGATLHER